MPLLRRLAPAALLASLAAPQAHAADVRHPVVVELFQSQGCSSCPPANANVQTIADRPDVLALSFSVTYWDQLGWKDTFARPAYTQRQWDYAHAFGHKNVFTPQVVVNGRKDGVGDDPKALARLVQAGDRGAGGPELAIDGATVKLGVGARLARPADVWLVRYDPHILQVPIRHGENGGKTLPHKNIVKQLVRLGGWNGQSETLRLPAGDPSLRTAVLVQAPSGGTILAAAKS